MFKQTQNFYFLIIFASVLTFASCQSDEEKAKEHLNKGIKLIEKHDLLAALTELDKSISYNPDNAHAYYYRGNTYYNLQKVSMAIEDYSRALELNPEHIDALCNRGNAKASSGDISGACEDWKKAENLGKENLEHKLRNCN